CCSTSAHCRYPGLWSPEVSRKWPSSSAPDRRNRSRSASRVRSMQPFEIVVEQLQDALVLVGPARLLLEAVVFYRKKRDRPVLFPELDQALHEAHGVLKEHVRVHHPVTDEERAFETIGEIHRRALAVRLGIFLRLVEDARRVRVIVVCPIRDR